MHLRIWLCLFIFLSCSSLDFRELSLIRNHYKNNHYEQVLKRLEKFPFKEKKSELLFYLEKGLTNFRLEKYKEAIDDFQSARSLVEKFNDDNFFNKDKVTLKNPLKRNFFAEKFERSYLYYYLGLSYFLLYQKSEGRDRNSLFSARAEMMAWDEFFKQEKKSLYFMDLQYRLLAGLIHESIGSRSEKEIAKKHYENALREIPLVNNLYRNFNDNASSYANDFFSKLKANKSIRKTYEPYSKNQKLLHLKEYFKERLTSLNVDNFKKTHISFLIDYKLVPKKRSKVIDLSINSFLRSDQAAGTKLLSLATNVAFKSYLYNTLGLKPSGSFLRRRQQDYTYHYYRRRTFAFNGGGVGPYFQFAIPLVENEISNEEMILVVFDKVTGRFVLSKKVILTSSLGEISKVTNKDRAGFYLLTTGARFLTKQLITLSASYAAHKAIKSKNNNGFAGLAGLLSFWGGSALSSFSEKADVRTWSSLPQEIYLAQMNLSTGEYIVKLKSKRTNTTILEKNIKVNNLSKNIFPLKLTNL